MCNQPAFFRAVYTGRLTEEDALVLVHPSVGKQERRIVERHARGRWCKHVIATFVLLEKVQKGRSHSIRSPINLFRLFAFCFCCCRCIIDCSRKESPAPPLVMIVLPRLKTTALATLLQKQRRRQGSKRMRRFLFAKADHAVKGKGLHQQLRGDGLRRGQYAQ